MLISIWAPIQFSSIPSTGWYLLIWFITALFIIIPLKLTKEDFSLKDASTVLLSLASFGLTLRLLLRVVMDQDLQNALQADGLMAACVGIFTSTWLFGASIIQLFAKNHKRD